MIGRKLAHYEILAQLGKGGMGEVYRARDTRLGREVAVKVLPPDLAKDAERRKRFLREAQAIAALKHPNIVTLYAVEEAEGLQFLTLELVEGDTLAARIPEGGVGLEDFFAIAIPLADAVASAHDAGITHRDLKPSNIMFDRDGRLKVLDFGLAKLLQPDAGGDPTETLVVASDTEVGQVIGTAAYMSPEQAEGKPIDHRSDIFSLGIVLYELSTGVRPFRGDTKISTISAILKDTPQLVSDLRRQLPRHLGRLVSHCLEKRPDDRYQSAKDVRNELVGLKREVDSGDVLASSERAILAPVARKARPRALWAGAFGVVALAMVAWMLWGRSGGSLSEPPAPPPPPGKTAVSARAAQQAPARKMVVVLPFENLGQAEDAYFAAGVTDEITSRLANVAQIGVISRSSATNYDRSGKSMRQIGDDLGVDFVLDGTVRWAKQANGADRVRITPQLVRVADDVQMWSEVYDRDIVDVFEVQTEIATSMISQLGVTLTNQERARVAEAPTHNLDAYKLYLRAEEIYDRDFVQAESSYVTLIEQALALDPDFVQAWAGLASFHLDWYSVFDKTDERLKKARQALRRAEALDPHDTATLVARGNYLYYGFTEYEQALREFEAAAAQSPSNAMARLQVGNIHRRLGNWDAALENQRMAVLLDPGSINHRMQLGVTLAGLRRFDEALECYRQVLGRGVQSDYFASDLLARALLASRGDLSGYEDPPPDIGPGGDLMRSYGLYLAGRYKEARAQFAQAGELPMRGFAAMKQLQIGRCLFYEGGIQSAREALLRARQDLERELDDAPGDQRLRCELAECLAYLGDAAAAVREARLAAEQNARDRFFGPGSLEYLASVYAILGQQEEALDILEQLSVTTYEGPITAHRLRIEPNWQSLRNHPRYRALLGDQT